MKHISNSLLTEDFPELLNWHLIEALRNFIFMICVKPESGCKRVITLRVDDCFVMLEPSLAREHPLEVPKVVDQNLTGDFDRHQDLAWDGLSVGSRLEGTGSYILDGV